MYVPTTDHDPADDVDADYLRRLVDDQAEDEAVGPERDEAQILEYLRFGLPVDVETRPSRRHPDAELR